MRFRDVTAEAGLQGAGYSMAAAAGDFDNDGHPDLFVAGVRRNILYHNRGDGTFEDITAKAGIGSDGVVGGSRMAGFRQRRAARPVRRQLCAVDPRVRTRSAATRRAISASTATRAFLKPTANRLYRNLGNGRFADVSAIRHREIPGQRDGRGGGRLRRRRLTRHFRDERQDAQFSVSQSRQRPV